MYKHTSFPVELCELVVILTFKHLTVISFFISGPSGKIMLLPETDPNATHIMIATGTGVAPYRGYLRRMFMEDVPNYRFGGLAWLFLGVANSDSLLYDEEFTSYLKQYPDNFRLENLLNPDILLHYYPYTCPKWQFVERATT